MKFNKSGVERPNQDVKLMLLLLHDQGLFGGLSEQKTHAFVFKC